MTVTAWPAGIGAGAMFPIAPGFERKPPRSPLTLVTHVTAGEDLPSATVSESFSLQNQHPHILESGSVTLNPEGILQWQSSEKNTSLLTSPWPISVRLSNDCHSANVLHEATNNGRFRLRIIKPISRGEELLAWFSHSLLPLVGIPFLTPFNIQGEKNYICHICGKAFEMPNPLKLHLSLDCDRDPLSVLWSRLGRENHPPSRFKFELTTSTTEQSPLPPAPSSTPSAFRPYWKGSASASTTLSESRTPQVNFNQQAAQMEALASNLGKSKQGHICIYCGKIYSRKYGLKIHIRTHTGYKPLQCKYCMRPFGDPSNLNKHVRLHAEGETPYKCDLCGKILVRRRDLERHLKSRHSNEEPAD